MYSRPDTFSRLCVGVWLNARAWRTIYTCMFPCADCRWYTVCVRSITAGDFLRRRLTQRCSHCSHHFSVAPSKKKNTRGPRELNGRSSSPHKATSSSLKLQKRRRPRSIFSSSGAESCSVRVGRRANTSHVKDRWRRRQLCARVRACLCVFIPMTTKMKTCTSLHREPNKGRGGLLPLGWSLFNNIFNVIAQWLVFVNGAARCDQHKNSKAKWFRILEKR